MYNFDMSITSTPSVLIVDDDSFLRESLAEILEDLSCIVDAVSDGLVAIEKIEQKQYDLIISDVDMPNISGFELINRAKKIKNNFRVVLMSARADDKMDAEAEKIGAVCLWKKPLSLITITNLINNLVKV